MKDIKFNLKLNETTSVFTLNELKENLTPELFPHFHSGKLAKWLRVRNLDEQAEKVQALLVSEKEHQAQLFKNLCDIFGKNMDENEAREILQSYKPSISEQNNCNDEEVEQLKAKNEELKSKIEELEHEEFLYCFVVLAKSLKICIEEIVNTLKLNLPIIEDELIYTDIREMKENLNTAIESVNEICETETNKVTSRKINFKHIETI